MICMTALLLPAYSEMSPPKKNKELKWSRKKISRKKKKKEARKEKKNCKPPLLMRRRLKKKKKRENRKKEAKKFQRLKIIKTISNNPHPQSSQKEQTSSFPPAGSVTGKWRDLRGKVRAQQFNKSDVKRMYRSYLVL